MAELLAPNQKGQPGFEGYLSPNAHPSRSGCATAATDSVRSDGSLLVNVGVNYTLRSLEFRLDLFNALNSGDADISHYYASRLNGEPPEGVDDVHFHPLEPRTLRGSVIWRL